ncbi:MAG: DGQHR domain-containing protein [Vicingaceae bacterium]|nr:DGQHR domain-containing protein [Vicingaceae bacterium]
MAEFPLKIQALEVKQPLGTFYLTKIKADILRQITFSIPLRTDSQDSEIIEYVGAQREIKERRLRQIGKFIDTVECAFPNTIIVAANYNKEGEHINDERRWDIEKQEGSNIVNIIIPNREKLASIVDGQHRLDGFDYVENSSRLDDVELPISVYLDLPIPYQAYLFASINHNQQPVSKSLSYILYGYSLDDELKEAWAPEKLAVYQSRKLNSNEDTPFYRKIKVAPQIDQVLLDKSDGWAVSTATVVDGILQLITKNAQRDRDEISKVSVKHGRNRSQLNVFNDDSPLRTYYLNNQDVVIYKAVENFFSVVVDIFFNNQNEDSSNTNSIMKTIGIQAMFDVLKEDIIKQKKDIIEEKKEKLNLTEAYFNELLSKFSKVNFADDFFPVASAAGRSKIRNFFLYGLGYKSEVDNKGKRLLKEDDVKEFNKRLKIDN